MVGKDAEQRGEDERQGEVVQRLERDDLRERRRVSPLLRGGGPGVRTCERMRTGSHPWTRKRCGAALVVTDTLGLRPPTGIEGKLSRAAGGMVEGRSFL